MEGLMMPHYFGNALFKEDLSDGTNLRKVLGQISYDSKILAALNSLGGRFADSNPGHSAVFYDVSLDFHLGLPLTSSHAEILRRGEELGLKICPAESPFQLIMSILRDDFIGALPWWEDDIEEYVFATPAIPVNDRSFVWTMFSGRNRISLDARVYDSADQKRIHSSGNYLFLMGDMVVHED